MSRKRHKHSLLIVLVILFLAVPFADAVGLRRGLLLDVVLQAVLIGGVYSLSGKRSTLVVGLCLTGPAILLTWAGVAGANRGLEVAGDAFYLSALLYLVREQVRHLFAARRVTMEILSAALSGYLLLGILWAVVFALVLHGNTHAIKGLPPEARNASDLIYFSFTTLTTLGYGDIVGVSRIARALAVLEAVVGQVYLTVIIARLVGMHIAGSSAPERA
jgi:hypothetical protein